MRLNVKHVLFTLVTWVAVIVVVNAVCGLVVGNRYVAVDSIDRQNADKSWGYFAPGQDKIILFPGAKEYRVRINALGLREVGKPLTRENIERQYRILTLGDSITFGLFNNDEDSYPYRLQQILTQAGKNAAVLNAGVGGAVQKDYLYYLKVKGLALKPNLVVISFCENDLNELDKEPLYERMKNDNVFSIGKAFKLTKFLRMFRKFELENRYQRWLKKTRDAKVRDILARKSQALEDVLFVQAYEGGLPATNPGDPTLTAAWQENFKVIRETVEFLRKEKIDVVYLIYPNIVGVFDRAKINYQDILGKYLRELKVETTDVLPAFKARRSEYVSLYNDLPRDFHLSGNGNQIMAEELYRLIKTRIQ